MTKDEALRLALEALENSDDLVRENAYSAEQLYGNYPARQGKVRGLKALVEDHEKAITAIKAALEAKDEPWEKFCDSNCVWTDHHPDCKLAKHEPVACGACNGSGCMVRDPDIGTDQECFVCKGSGVFEDITPPQQEAKDEPDKYAMDIECTKCGAKQSGVLTVHTTPPQRKVD